MGIAESEDQHKIFQRFSQTRQTLIVQAKVHSLG